MRRHPILRPAHGRVAAFTLVELLVVIAVLGILVTVVTLIAGRTIYNQRKANTLAIMRNCALAIGQFAQLDPLRSLYDRPDQATFGPYPPYMLRGNHSNAKSVAAVLEGADPLPNEYTLASRLHRDLGGGRGNVDDWVRLNGPDKNDDIRALYVYLKVFSPSAVNLLPPDRLKPLDPLQPEYVNPKGSGGQPDDQTDNDWVDVLAVHDAWDVPLDYLLYVRVKLEYDPRYPGDANRARYRVIDRRPVLRSRGIKRDAYESGFDDPSRWLFSEPLPQPWARVNRAGILRGASEGWVRAVAKGDSYRFRPDQDLK